MKRIISLVLAAVLVSSVLTAMAASPIYVDGSGNGVIYGSASDANAANGDSESGGGYYIDDNTGAPVDHYELPTEEEEVIDPNAPQKWEYDATQMTATWGNRNVVVVSLGTVVSVVRLGHTNVEVFTRELTFAPDIPREKTLAIIHAPRNAQVSMRKRPSNKSAIIMKCHTGRIVPVLGFSKNYVRVHYEDADGYVPANCLTFAAPAEGSAVMAYVAMDGNLRSRNTVNVRQEPSNAARILDELHCGQRVTVLEIGEKFCEIEARGLRCYLLTSWLVSLTDDEARKVPRMEDTPLLFAGTATLSDLTIAVSK